MYVNWSILEIYSLIKQLTDLIIFFLFIYILSEFFKINVFKKYKEIKNKENINIETLNVSELTIYIFIRMKNFKFFIVFLIYFIIFKKTAPILLIFFIIRMIKETPKLFYKNIEISLQSFSIALLQNLRGYCKISIILFYYLKLTKIYPEARCFTTLYAILEKKNKLNFYTIMSRIFISRLLGLPYKYLIYTIKTVDLFLKLTKENKNKKIKTRIKANMKIALKSPLIVILEETIIPMEISSFEKKIIKKEWKIYINPYFLESLRFLERNKAEIIYFTFSNKIGNQRRNLIHQALWLDEKKKIIIFTSSSKIHNEECIHFCNYYKSDQEIKQYYRIYDEKDMENVEIHKLKKEILRNFWINHKIFTHEGYVSMYVRAMIENKIHDEKLNKNELTKYREMKNKEVLNDLKNSKTYLNKILEDGYKNHKTKEDDWWFGDK